MGQAILLIVGGLMTLASPIVCVVEKGGLGVGPKGFVLFLVGMLVYGIGRFVGSIANSKTPQS